MGAACARVGRAGRLTGQGQKPIEREPTPTVLPPAPIPTVGQRLSMEYAIHSNDSMASGSGYINFGIFDIETSVGRRRSASPLPSSPD